MDVRVREPETKWVAVNGREQARLATERLGNGHSFVWAHSLLGCMEQDLEGGVLAWRELGDIASVIRFDSRGHGQSEYFGEPEDFAWPQLARNMWQVKDSYTHEPTILGGASMGCATALHAACQRPEQVRGLILVIPPTAWESRGRMKRNYRFIANLVNLTRAVPFRLLRFLRPKEKDGDFQRDMLQHLLKHLAKVKHQGVVGAMRGAALSDLPPREELAKLTMPTLILAWPDDATHPLEIAKSLRDTLPNAQLEVIKNPQDPYLWPALVRSFITSIDSHR